MCQHDYEDVPRRHGDDTTIALLQHARWPTKSLLWNRMALAHTQYSRQAGPNTHAAKERTGCDYNKFGLLRAEIK